MVLSNRIKRYDGMTTIYISYIGQLNRPIFLSLQIKCQYVRPDMGRYGKMPDVFDVQTVSRAVRYEL